MKSSILRVLSLLIVFGATALNSFGQLEFPEDKVHWKFTVEQVGDEATIIGAITMEEHWHIYAANLPKGSYLIASAIKLVPGAGFKEVSGTIEPKPIFEHDEITDEDLYYHANSVKLKKKIKVNSDKDFKLKGTFIFQTCDESHCLPPYEAEFTVNIKGVKAVEEVKGDTEFTSVDGDVAMDAKGNNYVNVNGEWHMVPKENSIEFYKKYLSLKLN